MNYDKNVTSLSKGISVFGKPSLHLETVSPLTSAVGGGDF